MSTIPPAPTTHTPKSYGAVVPEFDRWPCNRALRHRYDLAAIYPTVQGEGLNVGRAMTIVRLQGCPVGCLFCDTPETWDPRAAPLRGLTATDIAARVDAQGLGWALITGGEPTWHDLDALTEELRGRSIRTALETSGTMPRTGIWSWVTLSPKPAGKLQLYPIWMDLANEVKWIVGNRADVLTLEVWLREHPELNGGATILVQPMSAKPGPTAHCLQAVIDHPSWRLSLQTHKLLGIA